jgi:hypothetical protein
MRTIKSPSGIQLDSPRDQGEPLEALSDQRIQIKIFQELEDVMDGNAPVDAIIGSGSTSRERDSKAIIII